MQTPCKSITFHLILHSRNRISYNTIINHLMKTDISFHKFLPRHLRPNRIVIKNFGHSTLCTDISATLLE
jgi:hypothetical protein